LEHDPSLESLRGESEFLSIEEAFDVGEDTGSPIIEDVYAVPFRFAHLEKLTAKVGKG
jgi:hypothetical protein